MDPIHIILITIGIIFGTTLGFAIGTLLQIKKALRKINEVNDTSSCPYVKMIMESVEVSRNDRSARLSNSVIPINYNRYS